MWELVAMPSSVPTAFAPMEHRGKMARINRIERRRNDTELR